MEQDFLVPMVQAQLSHRFTNPQLLLQAFTRTSYSKEIGAESYELLEFVGKNALNFFVAKFLMQKFCIEKPYDSYSYDSSRFLLEFMGVKYEELICKFDNKKLYLLEERMLSRDTLAKRIDELGFAQFFRRGMNDTADEPQEVSSVKASLFKSIVGAVSVDCSWNLKEIESVIEALFDLNEFFLDDSETNYVRLIQNYAEEKCGDIPLYWFRGDSERADTKTANIPLYPDENITICYSCDLKLPDTVHVFRNFGPTKTAARTAVCKKPLIIWG